MTGERVKLGGAQVVALPVSAEAVDECVKAMLVGLRAAGAESDGLLIMVESVRLPDGSLALEVRGSGEGVRPD